MRSKATARLAACIVFILCAEAASQDGEPADINLDADSIRSYGIMARLAPERRDEMLTMLAGAMENLARSDKEQLQKRQRDFQYAFLLASDYDIRPTLHRDTVEAIDNALESIFTFEDINRDNTWEPLIYVYGFFNHDVTPATMREVISTWRELPERQKRPRYPTYIHSIDAVTKPLAVGGLESPERTRRALEIAIPMLKEMLTQAPAPGTAFHPPSHACLVLGPLYQRWAQDTAHGDYVTEQLGDSDEFVALMAGQLAGAQPDPENLSDFEFGFYAYTGRYIANALARMNARTALPVLEASLALYEERGARGASIAYTRRAMIALGHEQLRAALEDGLDEPQTRDTAVWLCRNGQGETRAYGQKLLGRILKVAPGAALTTHFREELKALQP